MLGPKLHNMRDDLIITRVNVNVNKTAMYLFYMDTVQNITCIIITK